MKFSASSDVFSLTYANCNDIFRLVLPCNRRVIYIVYGTGCTFSVTRFYVLAFALRRAAVCQLSGGEEYDVVHLAFEVAEGVFEELEMMCSRGCGCSRRGAM